MKSFLTAGLALAACAALAVVEEQTFESAEVGTKPTGWTGDAAVAASGESARGKVLAVDGTVTCANSGKDSQWGKTTFLVKAPEDATTDLPTATDIGDNCQIAVATGAEATDGTLKVMVYQGGTTPAWVEAPNVTVTKGAWFSVVLDFDYSVSKVQVLVNDTSAGWFPLVTPLEASVKTSKINSLAFVGSTKVDDVSIAEVNNVPVEALPAAIKGLNKIDLAAQGVTLAQIVANATVGSSGLTVQQKLESGLDPTDNSKFTATALTPAADGKIAVTVPYAFDNGQKYTVVMTDETGAQTETTVEPVIDSVNKTATLTVTPGSGKVLKVQVEAIAPTPAAK